MQALPPVQTDSEQITVANRLFAAFSILYSGAIIAHGSH